MKNKDLAVGVACGLVVGAVAGAVAALLLAPASGSETRRKLLYERDHTLDTARNKARRAMARLRRAQADEEVAEEAEVEVGAEKMEEEAGEEVAFIGA